MCGWLAAGSRRGVFVARLNFSQVHSHPITPPLKLPLVRLQDGAGYTSGRINTKQHASFYSGMQVGQGGGCEAQLQAERWHAWKGTGLKAWASAVHHGAAVSLASCP